MPRRCAKRRYRTEKAAKKVIRSIRRAKKEGYGVLHAYLCPFCGWWHVGHRPW